MHRKWDRKKKLWVAVIVLVIAVILLVIFLMNNILGADAGNQPSKEMVSTDGTNVNNVGESSETESADEDRLTVENAYVNEENHLILVYSNGKEIDTGVADALSGDAQEQFKVVFEDYDGTILKEEFVSSGRSATPPATPNKQGHIFVGWNGSYTEIVADTTLIAVYVPVSEKSTTYTVQFVDYDGVVLKTETVLEGAAAISPGTPLRKGYDFVGWDKPFDNVTSDLVVKAQYSAYSGPEFVVEDVEAAAGSENIAVTVRLKNNPGVASLKFAVAYSDDLTLTKAEYNSELGGHSLIPQKLDSPTTLIWVNPFENKTGDWVFATLYFAVAESAEGSLPITVTYDPNDVYDMTETNVKFRVSNGTINVR